MRTIQEIFNAVIDNGLYTEQMCYGIGIAAARNIITKEEEELVNAEVRRYLCDLGGNEDYWSDEVEPTLAGALRNLGFSYTKASRLKIYLQWADRPMPSLQQLRIRPTFTSQPLQ